MYLWMADGWESMEQRLLCGCVSLQRNLAAVFWTMEQQQLLVWKKTMGYLGRSVGPFPWKLYARGLLGIPTLFKCCLKLR